MLHLELQDKLDKKVCTQSSFTAFTAYTRQYQQIQSAWATMMEGLLRSMCSIT